MMDDSTLQAWLDSAEVLGFEPPLDLAAKLAELLYRMANCDPNDVQTLKDTTSEMEAMATTEGMTSEEWRDIVVEARAKLIFKPRKPRTIRYTDNLNHPENYPGPIPGTRLWW